MCPFLSESACGIKEFSKLHEEGTPFFPLGAGCGLSRPRVALEAPEFPCTCADSLAGACCTRGSAATAKPPFPKQKCQKRRAFIYFPSET